MVQETEISDPYVAIADAFNESDIVYAVIPCEDGPYAMRLVKGFHIVEEMFAARPPKSRRCTLFFLKVADALTAEKIVEHWGDPECQSIPIDEADEFGVPLSVH
jgi:hypothetical protein